MAEFRIPHCVLLERILGLELWCHVRFVIADDEILTQIGADDLLDHEIAVLYGVQLFIENIRVHSLL